jgi:hypothetical protein
MVSIYFSSPMNSNAYIVSGIIAFVFLVAKFIEMRFANNNNKSSGEEDEAAQPKPLKLLLRDALLVYVSSLLGFYIIAQFEEHSSSGTIPKEVPAFTGGPDF